jgi:hypothetical protein
MVDIIGFLDHLNELLRETNPIMASEWLATGMVKYQKYLGLFTISRKTR